MVSSCCVVGCANRYITGNGIKFFTFPKVRKRFSQVYQDKLQRRRDKWIAAVNRNNVDNTNVDTLKICSVHFTSGVPSHLTAETDSDWAPSIEMGYEEISEERSAAICQRYNRWVCRNSNHTSLEENVDFPNQNENNSQISIPSEPIAISSPGTNSKNSTGEDDNTILIENENENHENQSQKETIEFHAENEIADLPFSEAMFAGDDDKIKFYTAIPNMKLFNFILKHVKGSFTNIRDSNLTSSEMLILTLMKLRLNDEFVRIGYDFKIKPFSAGKIFRKAIVCIEYIFHEVLHWPDRKAIQCTTPDSFGKFRRMFGLGNRPIRVIIDCFEIKTEKPASFLGKSQVFSSYKHYHTLKYLIGITPSGFISFISKGWGGRTSDTEIIQRSEFLDLLSPGDVVVADRGFGATVHQLIEKRKATLLTPTFVENQQQIHPVDVEKTRALASCRIHVERVIGTLRNKFKILRGPIPISILQYEYAGDSLYDIIVRVCCILFNLCDPIVKK